MQRTFLTLLSFAAFSLGAATLELTGVVGNSGAFANPVTFASTEAFSLGGAYDAARGVYYERGGKQKLNAYTLDGRLVATYPLPGGSDRYDTMVLCGNNLFFSLGGKLYAMPLNAKSGSSPKAILPEYTKVTTFSASSHKGSFLFRTADAKLYSLHADTLKATHLGAIETHHVHGLDYDENGDIFAVLGPMAHKFADGKLLANDEWPRRFIGNREPGIDRAQKIGNYWYGFAGHGTIKRFDSEFNPAPGTVYGGASGHFIGTVKVDYDLNNGRGIHEISPGVFIVSGRTGVVQIAEWRPKLQQFEMIRRIGALPELQTLALDPQGRLLFGHNIWNADADSRAPAAVGLPFVSAAPAAAFGADSILFPLLLTGRPSLANGQLEFGKMNRAPYPKMELPKNLAGVACVSQEKQTRLLFLTPEGKLLGNVLNNSRSNVWKAALPEQKMELKTPVKRWTSLAVIDDKTLLGAADGSLIELLYEKGVWNESKRWSDGFGADLSIAVNGTLAAVADKEKGNVAIYDLKTQVKLAEAPAGKPARTAFNAGRVIVYDQAGQRLLKFEYKP